MANDSDGSRLLKRPKCDSTDGQARGEPKKARLEHSKSSPLPAVLQSPTVMSGESNGLSNREMGWNAQFGESSFGTHGEPVVDTPPLSPKSTSRTNAPTDFLPDPSEMDIQILFATLTTEVDMEFQGPDHLWKSFGKGFDSVACYPSSIKPFSYQHSSGLPLENEPSMMPKTFLENGTGRGFDQALTSFQGSPFELKCQTLSCIGIDDVDSVTSSDTEDDIWTQDSESTISSIDGDIREPSHSTSPEALSRESDRCVNNESEHGIL